jgi:hypothetical protein
VRPVCVTLLAILTIATGPGVEVYAQSKPQSAAPETASQAALRGCLVSALKEYSQAQLAFRMLVSPTPDALVAHRRLQETYCLRRANCVADLVGGEKVDLIRASEFSSCLETETLELYDAKRR